MSDVDTDLISIVSRFFAEKATQEVVQATEQSGLDLRLWGETAGLGLTGVGLDEARGGSGGSLRDLVAVLIAAGKHAVPLPLVETHLAAWLSAEAGQGFREGPMAFCSAAANDSLLVEDGTVTRALGPVPWARDAEHLLILGDGRLVSVEAADLQISEGRDLAGMPRDRVVLNGAPATVAPTVTTPDRLQTRASLLYAALLAGSIEAASDLTRQYVGERKQFGRPIGGFQAVQQHVVTLAQMATMSVVTVERAAVALENGDGAFEVAAAKLVVNQNAATAARAAHQAHGAIGMTQEYRLQQLTRRMHTWRLDWGTELELAARIGGAAATAPRLGVLVAGY